MTTLANAPQKIALRPRPAVGLGYQMIGQEEEDLVLQVVRSRQPFRYYGTDTKNPPSMAANLEKEWAAMMGGKYALAVTSGTAALETALGALAIGPGDEVILPAWSWISCWTAIIRVGATPVLAEIDENLCLAPGEITRLKTLRTKAAMVIHFQGVAADMDKIVPECKAAGIKLIEDCAEAAGVTYKGKYVGSFADVACYSLQYNKVITSGEGGLVMCNDPILYERAVRMHDLGQVRPYHAQILGGKTQVPAFAGDQFRMNELSAAMGLAQLRKLGELKSKCRKIQSIILEKLQGLKGVSIRPVPDPTGDLGFEMYVYLPDKATADAIRHKLDAANVNCNKITGTYNHYAREYGQNGHAHSPTASPFHDIQMPAKGYRPQDFPRTESLVYRFIALPIGVKYTEEDAVYIGDAFRQAHAEVVENNSAGA
ncbi:MAG TPA: DegT/DnrJ/EryC1/StrS family aminotransferase [Tepidisphaeraceae bacterium]|jgi:8-amino-3,8-dideoxy-alpha-D-manno-octulosonate transaminase|nr:DegT/DnrJ/EryC1/StrS family aminotransferase [Tepidisphaeraceae bacterium]